MCILVVTTSVVQCRHDVCGISFFLIRIFFVLFLYIYIYIILFNMLVLNQHDIFVSTNIPYFCLKIPQPDRHDVCCAMSSRRLLCNDGSSCGRAVAELIIPSSSKSTAMSYEFEEE